MKPEKVSVPVICIGNFVMGGAGKTPTVIALVDILKEMGHVPHILSRGYGAYIRDTVRVDPQRHNYLQVGDEPLLLAQVAPTWAGPNRVRSAKAAIAKGASVLIMDDGMQNASLQKDVCFTVLDAKQSIGNGLVFPAGPLREPIERALRRTHAVILIGGENPLPDLDVKTSFSAHIVPEHLKKLPHKRVIGFAGLGFPEKFRSTLEQTGFCLCGFEAFADHYPYTIPDMIRLVKYAKDANAHLITTSKDWIRIPSAYQSDVLKLPVHLVFDHPDAIKQFLHSALDVHPTHM
jgi:tetraacyldisaccharide 4'-kinase